MIGLDGPSFVLALSSICRALTGSPGPARILHSWKNNFTPTSTRLEKPVEAVRSDRSQRFIFFVVVVYGRRRNLIQHCILNTIVHGFICSPTQRLALTLRDKRPVFCPYRVPLSFGRHPLFYISAPLQTPSTSRAPRRTFERNFSLRPAFDFRFAHTQLHARKVHT